MIFQIEFAHIPIYRYDQIFGSNMDLSTGYHTKSLKAWVSISFIKERCPTYVKYITEPMAKNGTFDTMKNLILDMALSLTNSERFCLK